MGFPFCWAQTQFVSESPALFRGGMNMQSLNRFALFAALAIFLAAASQSRAQNALANPSFEQPVTADGPPFVGSWEAFNGGTGSSAANSTASPRTGAQNLALTINNTDATFAGVF